MQLVRTTVRLEKQLKKEAERTALDENTTLQDVLNRALRYYIQKKAVNKAKKIVFKSIDLGVPLDNLTRDDIYGEPEIPC